MATQRRPHIEDALVLDITKIMAAADAGSGCLTLGEEPLMGRSTTSYCLVWFKLQLAQTHGMLTLSYDATVNGETTFVDEVVQMETTTPNYGGRRWWFRCEITGRRATKLYLFPNRLRFCHRTGIDPDPTYLSQRVWGMDRIYRRLYALRQSLPGQGTIRDTLRRPRGMHLSTYLRHLMRDKAIWDPPQNTLLAWCQKHCQGDKLLATLPDDLDTVQPPAAKSGQSKEGAPSMSRGETR